MSDNFGRQKSSRWVRASIPTYGDDWGNEYDYDAYESNEEERESNTDVHSIKDTHDKYIEDSKKDEQIEDKVSSEGIMKEQLGNTPSNLVLTIDNFKNTDSDNDSFDSSSEDEVMPDVLDDGRQHNVNGTDKDSSEFDFNQNDLDSLDLKPGEVIETQYVARKSKEDILPPPTPSFSQGKSTFPDTPLSERSFHSDVDSIQNEPESLNVVQPNRFISEKNVIPEALDKDVIAEALDKDVDETESNIEEDKYETKDTGDKDTLTDKAEPVDQSTEPYENESPLYLVEEDLNLSYTKPELNDSNERHVVRTDALDSLINDLQNASINYDATDGDNDMSYDQGLYSHETESGYNYSNVDRNNDNLSEKNSSTSEELENNDSYSIEPLAINEEKELHENYINELSGHKRSVRKPPPSRQNLVSVDYSNIADAVSGYMSDQDDSNKDAQSKMNSIASKESIVDENLQTSMLDAKFSPPQIQREAFDSSDDINRRASTASANTFTLGSWQPNTGNFRDKFINDNDNESNINFNPYGDTNSNYNDFTKLGTVKESSDNDSQRTSVSIPDTVDLELPDTIEDEDDNDDDDDDENIEEDSQCELGYQKTNSSTEPADLIVDSLGGDGLILKQVVEQKRIPSQKINSLLSPLEKKPSISEVNTKDVTERERKVSESEASIVSKTTLNNENTGETKSVFKKEAYPVYNWKTIMATSQPKDRIRLLKEALEKEYNYNTGLQSWINETLKQSENSSNIHIGKIAAQAYQNATHSDIRRHGSLRSKVSIVKDKVETSGLQASTFSKRFFNRGKKFMKSGSD